VYGALIYNRERKKNRTRRLKIAVLLAVLEPPHPIVVIEHFLTKKTNECISSSEQDHVMSCHVTRINTSMFRFFRRTDPVDKKTTDVVLYCVVLYLLCFPIFYSNLSTL